MQNRMIRGLIIAVMIAGITLYVSHEKGKEREQQQRETTKNRIFAEYDPEKVLDLELRRSGAENIVVQKEKDGWNLKHPVHARADLTTVNRMLNVLAKQSASSYSFSEVNDLGRLGLAPGKEAAMLFLGDYKVAISTEVDPIKNLRYIGFNKRIYLVEDDFFYFLVSGYPSFINRLILPEEKDIAAIETNKFIITKGENSWETTPYIKPGQLELLFANWKKAFSERVSLLKKDRKIDEAQYIKIELEGEERSRLFFIVKDKEKLILINRRLGIEYYLPLKLEKELLPDYV